MSRSRVLAGEPTDAETPVALLGACHARIREHLRMARVLAEATEAEPESAIVATARAVDRYFRIALPQHVEDEEKSIAPRLPTHEDTALARMRGEHRAHEPRLAALLSHTAAIEGAPRELDAHRVALRQVVTLLTEELEAHLVYEEAALFPAIARLSPHDAGAVVLEMRARRR